MEKVYLGIDIGTNTTKGVIINNQNKIIAKNYLYNKNNILKVTNNLINKLLNKIDKNKYIITCAGITGVNRKVANNINIKSISLNEINASITAINELYPKINTIIELGGKDYKIIELKNSKLYKYKINNIYNYSKINLYSDYYIKINNNNSILIGGRTMNKKIIKNIQNINKHKFIISKDTLYINAIGAAINAKTNKVIN